MIGFPKTKGVRLSTRLILNYFLVALITVVAAGVVALPLLQHYQDDRNELWRQRLILEYNDRLNSLINVMVQQRDSNPFHEYLLSNPKVAPAQRVWPTAPSIDVVREKFNEISRESEQLRLLVMTVRDREVKVDTETDPKLSLQGETLTGLEALAPTPSPTAGTTAGATPAPTTSATTAASARAIDATITLSSGKAYNILYRTAGTVYAPNLFGITNRSVPLEYIVAIVIPPLPSTEVWADLLLILTLAALVAMAFSLIVGLLLARQLSRPLVRLTRASQAVAQGDYEQRVTPAGGYELTRLAEAFNQMTYNVAESQRMQRQLIANVSHELKTPLTSIQGFSHAMLDGALIRQEEYARAAEIISTESDRMIRLVYSLLDLSKLESGQAALQRHEMDLAGTLDSCIESFLPRAEAQDVRLVKDFQSPLLVNGDSDRLRQVFNNLIDNALKYTPERGRITVKGYNAGKNIIITLTDTGVGIPSVDLPHIFERFYQADKSRRRDQTQEGTGLGLAIVKEIIQAHGGKIDAVSTEGMGTQFTVVLPAIVNNISKSDSSSGTGQFHILPVVNKK
ncbi:MAG TPA: HAMP domain-containing sensor histidine kinase [Chloroflexia bacterium]|nr:HAMP domain-containing sensor histidine kinase [Chloroflexia bacterium]